MLDPLAPGAPAAPAGTVGPAAGRRAAGPSSALAQLSVQKGEPLSVLLADLAEEASFLHAESLEDAAKKKEKLGDRLEDAVRQRELRLIEQVRSVWEEEDGALGKDAEELRRRRGQEGRSGFEQALARYAGGDASREAALLLRLMEDDPPHAGEYREDLARLLAERSRAVEAGAASLPFARRAAQEGGERLGELQALYQSAAASGDPPGKVLAAVFAAFGVERFAAGCDFLSRTAASELSAESRPLERAQLGEVTARLHGLRVFQTAAARFEQTLERVRASAEKAGSPPPDLSPHALTERFFAAVGEPVRFEAGFAETLDGLAPEPRLRLLQELREAGRELPGWVFANEIERNRLLQPIQESIDYLVYEAGV